MDTQKPPAITPEQAAAVDDVREKIKNQMATIPAGKGGAAMVLIQLTVTPEGRPLIFIETNCPTKEEAAVAVHLGRLLLPLLEGLPNSIEQAGAMMAGRDPRTGAKLVPDSGSILIVE